MFFVSLGRRRVEWLLCWLCWKNVSQTTGPAAPDLYQQTVPLSAGATLTSRPLPRLPLLAHHFRTRPCLFENYASQGYHIDPKTCSHAPRNSSDRCDTSVWRIGTQATSLHLRHTYDVTAVEAATIDSSMWLDRWGSARRRFGEVH
jgi:hypothetical protein